jgi:hypothetical protein
MSKTQVIWLAIFEAAYIVAWVAAENQFPSLGEEWMQLVLLGPAAFMGMLLITSDYKEQE